MQDGYHRLMQVDGFYRASKVRESGKILDILDPLDIKRSVMVLNFPSFGERLCAVLL